MRTLSKVGAVLSVLFVLGVAAVGCGGGAAGATSEAEPAPPSAAFLKSGADNKIANFGREADVAQREAASMVLAENLQARASGDWKGQCTSLSASEIKTLLRTITFFGRTNCERILAAAAAEASSSVRADTMTGPIAAFRVRENRGYALYHGTDRVNYAMKMRRENGKWKVDSLLTIALP